MLLRSQTKWPGSLGLVALLFDIGPCCFAILRCKCTGVDSVNNHECAPQKVEAKKSSA